MKTTTIRARLAALACAAGAGATVMGGAFAVAATRGAPTGEAAISARSDASKKPPAPVAQITGLAGFVPAKLPAKLVLKPLVIHPRQIVVVARRTNAVQRVPTGTTKKDPWASGSDWSASGSSSSNGNNDAPPPPPPPPGTPAP